METTMTNVEQILLDAEQAGREAAETCVPNPMVVQSQTQSYFVSEGLCGFAWVTIRPARGAFVSFLKKRQYGSPGYNGGYQIWVSDYGQSYARKLAYANAFAKSLQENGVVAVADGRLD